MRMLGAPPLHQVGLGDCGDTESGAVAHVCPRHADPRVCMPGLAETFRSWGWGGCCGRSRYSPGRERSWVHHLKPNSLRRKAVPQTPWARGACWREGVSQVTPRQGGQGRSRWETRLGGCEMGSFSVPLDQMGAHVALVERSGGEHRLLPERQARWDRGEASVGRGLGVRDGDSSSFSSAQHAGAMQRL